MQEAALYPLVKTWAESPRFPSRKRNAFTRFTKVEVTASLQWLGESGDWMRPDVAVVEVLRRKYDPYPDVAVHAIEIKTGENSLTPALFQALSYSRIADYCYLAAPASENWTSKILELGKRFGVGLIRFDQSARWDTFRTTEATRMTPDQTLREQFINAAFPNDQDELLRAIGTQQ